MGTPATLGYRHYAIQAGKYAVFVRSTLLFGILFSAPVVRAQTLPDAPSTVVAKEIHQFQTISEPTSEPGDGTQDRPKTNTPSPGSSQSKDNSEPRQTKRMLWVVPNFAAVNPDTKFTPLTPHDKFVLASQDSFDYSSFVWTAIITAQSYALNSDPELGRGMAGYARYYWRAYTDGVSGTFFTEAIVPVISHEDPRYFTQGHDSFSHRLYYAISRTFLTKKDSGGTTFNWSEIGGNAMEAALSNAYYPPQERGVNQTLRDWGTQIESAALNNIAKEFWPDIRRDVFRRK